MVFRVRANSCAGHQGEAGWYPTREVWVVERTGVEQGDKDAQEPVGHAAQRATVSMPALAQSGVVSAARRITDGGDPRPMVQRIAQSPVARIAHVDGAPFTALL